MKKTNLTLTQAVREALDALAAEDAMASGRPPNLTATVSALVLSEKRRRGAGRRGERGRHPTGHDRSSR